MYQNMTLIGRLGKDPETRYTPEGKVVATFDVAVDAGTRDKTMWVRITTWEKLAENCNAYLKKGSMVHVEGMLSSDKDGNPKVSTRKDGTCGSVFEVSARRVTFLSPKDEYMVQEPAHNDDDDLS